MTPLPDASAALAALLIPAIRDAVVLTDIDGRVTYWNDGAVRVFGWSTEEMVGRPVIERLPAHARDEVTEQMQAVLAGAEWRGECEDYRKDGSRVWLDASVRALRTADGATVGVLGIAEDITERKRAEQSLRESEARLRVALEAAGAVAFSWDVAAGHVVRHYSVEPALPANIDAPESAAEVRARVHPDDRPAFDAGVAACIEGSGSDYRNLFRVVRPDGTFVWLEEWGHLERDADGAPLRLTGVAIDVTERKRTESALMRHNRVLELIAKGTPLPTTLTEVVRLVEEQLQDSLCSVLLVDGSGRFRLGAAPSLPAEYNAAVDGVPIGPLNGSCGAAAFHGETIVVPDIATAEVWRAHKDLPLAHGLRSCLSVPILASGHVPGLARGKVLGTFAVYRREPGPPDPQAFALLSGAWTVSADAGASASGRRIAGAAHLVRVALERHLAEDALRASEARFRSVLDASPAIVYLKDLDGRYLFVNQRVVDVMGLPYERWIGHTARELLPAATAEQFERNDRLVMESLQPHQVEETAQAHDGRTITALSLQFPLFLANGEPYALCGISTDITERRAAQEERDYLWNNSPDPVCIAGYDGYLHQINPAWTQRLGWTTEELQTRPWLEFVHPDDVVQTRAAGERLLRGEPVHGLEHRFRAMDGSYRWFSWNAIPFVERKSMYGFIRDITEEKRLGEQIRQTQKMEAIGQLAGGVAHDFNNLLTVINGYTTLLLSETRPLAPEREALAAVREAGDRAAALTAQLLAFSRKAIVEPKVMDLNETTAASIRLLRRLVGEDIHLETKLASALPKIRIDPGQLDQVVMNLVVNARDAMPTGGVLRVATASRLVSAVPTGEAIDVPAGRYVCLSVSDSGAGMTDAVKSHIFEPFFTTKAIGKGTGLGLATVYGIVRQAGGTVLVESAVGHGTAFHVLFPAVNEVPAAGAPVPAHGAPQGHETLLVVEDEDAVRRFTRLALELQGYIVHEASSATQALAMPPQALDSVDLLITDVVMPVTGGRQLADALRQRHPRMRVLYMSGYTDDAVVRHGLESATDAFLQKPFTPEALGRKVREVLDATPPRDAAPQTSTTSD